MAKFAAEDRGSANIFVCKPCRDLILRALLSATVLVLLQAAAEEKINCPKIVQTGAGR
jgi:hypothetical protein